MSWRGGVIAAGHGERLRAGGWTGSKAMLPLGGRALIDHTLDRFAGAAIEAVVVLVNADSADAAAHLAARQAPPAVDLVVRTTPSSFASFALVAERLGDGPAVVTTVDAVLPPEDFKHFLAAAARLPAGSLALGVTRHVDDEKPLWAELAGDSRMVTLGGASGTHVTAGLYAWTGELPRPGVDHPRLRDYLRALVEGGQPVFGIELPMVLDVDRPADVDAATRALREWTTCEVEA